MRLFLFAYLITEHKTNNVSNQTQKCLTGCGKRNSSMPLRGRNKENEIQFLTEAKLTPRNVARLGYAGRQRSSSAPLSRDVAPRLCDRQRGTSTFAGRPACEYARQIQHRSHGNAKACRQYHYVRRSRRSRDSTQRPRRQI